MNFPFWNPIDYFWYLMWFPFLAVGLLGVALVYFLDWISGERCWGTKFLNRIGA